MAQPHNTLPPGVKLHWYQIESVLGHGGFGLTYLAMDTNLNQKVAIKEYLPGDLAHRASDSTVRPKTEDGEQIYAWGLDRFLKEARTLVQFKHPNIVRVMSVFEANNTAYMVMEYEHGQALDHLMRGGKYRTEKELREMIFPILDGLVQVHEAGFIHRDIKPGNIYIREDGSPVLLDFGSARQSVSSQTQSMTSLYTPGYAPFEQYHESEGRQGPWTDVYSLGAMLYLGASGSRPVDALKRSAAYLHNTQDPYVPLADVVKGKFSKHFINAIDQALNFREAERPQNTEDFKRLLDGKKPKPKSSKKVKAPKAQATKVQAKDNQSLVMGLVATLVIAGVAIAGYWWWTQQQDPAIHPTTADRSVSKPATQPAAAGARQTQINQLLAQADQDTRAGRLIAPRGNNALERYREVLKLDAANEQAQSGVESITNQVSQQIERVLSSGQLDRAESAIEVAEKSLGALPALAALKEQLESARAEEQQQREAAQAARLAKKAELKKMQEQRRKEQEEKTRLAEERKKKAAEQVRVKAEQSKKRQQEINTLLVQATADIAAGRLANSPDGNDALSRYQAVLKLDPGNQTASKGIAQLTEKLTAQASQPVRATSPSASNKVSVHFVVYADHMGNVERASKSMARIIQGVTRGTVGSSMRDLDISYQGVTENDNFFIDSKRDQVAQRLCSNNKVTHLLGAIYEKHSGGFSEYMYVSSFNCVTGHLVKKRYEIYYTEQDSGNMGGGGVSAWRPGWKTSIRKFLQQERPFH